MVVRWVARQVTRTQMLFKSCGENPEDNPMQHVFDLSGPGSRAWQFFPDAVAAFAIPAALENQRQSYMHCVSPFARRRLRASAPDPGAWLTAFTGVVGYLRYPSWYSGPLLGKSGFGLVSSGI